MIITRVFLVLLVLIPLCSGGLMLLATCKTIKNQLLLIADTINHRARDIQTAPFYTTRTVDERLKLLLDSYQNMLQSYQPYVEQVSTFVQGKLKQFSIPVNDLEENTLQLEKIFSWMEDRFAFQELQLKEQKHSYVNLTTELENNQQLLEALKETQRQLQSQLVILHHTLKSELMENRKLQAKINDNPTTVQG